MILLKNMDNNKSFEDIKHIDGNLLKKRGIYNKIFV